MKNITFSPYHRVEKSEADKTAQRSILKALSVFTRLELSKDGIFADVKRKGGVFLLWGYLPDGKRKLVTTIFHKEHFSYDCKRLAVKRYSFVFTGSVVGVLTEFWKSGASNLFFHPDEYEGLALASKISPRSYQKAHTFTEIKEGE